VNKFKVVKKPGLVNTKTHIPNELAINFDLHNKGNKLVATIAVLAKTNQHFVCPSSGIAPRDKYHISSTSQPKANFIPQR